MKISQRNFIKGTAGLMALAAFPNFANGGKKMPADLVKVYLMPDEINNKIAEIKLDAIGAQIDTLTDEQRTYLGI